MTAGCAPIFTSRREEAGTGWRVMGDPAHSCLSVARQPQGGQAGAAAVDHEAAAWPAAGPLLCRAPLKQSTATQAQVGSRTTSTQGWGPGEGAAGRGQEAAKGGGCSPGGAVRAVETTCGFSRPRRSNGGAS